jgi:hypothetical protein
MPSRVTPQAGAPPALIAVNRMAVSTAIGEAVDGAAGTELPARVVAPAERHAVAPDAAGEAVSGSDRQEPVLARHRFRFLGAAVAELTRAIAPSAVRDAILGEGDNALFGR